jgi:hypothetical protein
MQIIQGGEQVSIRVISGQDMAARQYTGNNLVNLQFFDQNILYVPTAL